MPRPEQRQDEERPPPAGPSRTWPECEGAGVSDTRDVEVGRRSPDHDDHDDHGEDGLGAREDRPPRRPGMLGSPWSLLALGRRRPDSRLLWSAVAVGALSLACSAVFVAVDLLYNDGRFVAPLDDVYIHLQYGRQIGSGQGFSYNPGDPVSTGASSLLYALVLGLIWAAGFQGALFLPAAVALGAACVAVTAPLALLLGDRLGGRAVGLWTGALTAVSGPLLWGATSGMEVGLVAVLVTATVLAFVVEQPRAWFVWTPPCGVLLALVRPEGLILAAALCAGMIWTLARAAWSGSRSWPRAVTGALLAVLPLVAGAAQFAFYRLSTGKAQANGVAAKSWLNQGLLDQPSEAADHTLRNLQELLSSLAGLSAQDLVPPVTGLLAVVGLVALGLGTGRDGARRGGNGAVGPARRRTVAVAVAGGLAAVLLSVSTLITAQWQNLRYVQPFLPLVLVLAVVGVAAVTDAVGRSGSGGSGRAAFHGVLTTALVFTLVVTPTWALRLGQQAATIREAPISIANWLRGYAPPDSTVAVNDVGAVAYFSGLRTVDLVGLTTNGMAPAANNGAGTLYERLAELPPEARPDFFSIYDHWPGVNVPALQRSGVLGDDPLITFHLKSPARPVSGFAPPPCQTDRTCDAVNVWKADWSLVGTGALPDAPVAGVVRDHLNVGSLDDEAAHGWTVNPPVLGVQPVSDVTRRELTDGRTIVDSSRRVVGGETFTLRNLVPGRAVTLTARVDPRRDGARPPATVDDTVPAPRPSPEAVQNRVRQDVAVTVDGRSAGRWFLTGPADPGPGWTQSSFLVPPELVTGPELRVTTGPTQTFLGPYPDYRSYGYWASQ